MARPTKLTREVQERVVAAVRAGNYAEAACQASGISSSTYYRWMARGEAESSGIHAAFRDAILQAQAVAEVHAVAVLRQAMAEDWRAALAYLERRHPARWRRQQVTELTGKDGAPLWGDAAPALDLSGFTDEELATFQALSDRASSGGSSSGEP